MKDKLLIKYTNSPKFKRLPKPQQIIELHDYQYQKKMFDRGPDEKAR